MTKEKGFCRELSIKLVFNVNISAHLIANLAQA
jgi:hypothetical protein